MQFSKFIVASALATFGVGTSLRVSNCSELGISSVAQFEADAYVETLFSAQIYAEAMRQR